MKDSKLVDDLFKTTEKRVKRCVVCVRMSCRSNKLTLAMPMKLMLLSPTSLSKLA